MPNVFTSIAKVYTQVIHKYLKELPKVLLECMSHEPLKCCQCICQAKQHYFVSINALFYGKFCFVLVFFLDGNLVVA